MTTPFTFHIPGGILRTEELLGCTQRLRALGKDVSIEAFDTVQGLQWNGGRLVFSHKFLQKQDRYSDVTLDNIDEAVQRIQRINDAGIPFTLTFNSTMESLDVEDEAGNYLLQKLHNGMNGVTVATESLRRHIRANYPNYFITASICYTYSRVDELQAAFQRFDKVVAMPVLAYEEDNLQQLPMDRLIFILNDRCYLFCVRKDHYDYISRCSLAGHSTLEEQKRNQAGTKCFVAEVPGYRNKVRDASEVPRNIRISQIVERHQNDPFEATRAGFNQGFNITAAARKRLFEIGVRHYKLQGREFDDRAYQERVIQLVERIAREELPG